jgi:Acetyltransferase (GNAT) domain
MAASGENPDFFDLPPPVAQLFATAAEGSFFALPAWYDVLSRHGIEPARIRLYLDDRTMPRAAILCRAAEDGRTLSSLSSYYSTEHGPLLDPAAPDDALARIVAAIAADRPRWDGITMDGLDPAAPSFTRLTGAFRAAGWSVRPFFDSGTWYLGTQGLDFAAYLAARPSALRHTLRRKTAKLEAGKRLGVYFIDGETGIERGIADYEAVYRTSWKGSEPFPEFMPHLIRAAARLGALRLGVLILDGAAVAAQIWLMWRGRATIYKLAHDSRHDALSVGTILTLRMMQHVLDNDRPWEVDFGRGDDGYKKDWLPRRRERWGFRAANPRTPRGLALCARITAANLLRPPRIS